MHIEMVGRVRQLLHNAQISHEVANQNARPTPGHVNEYKRGGNVEMISSAAWMMSGVRNNNRC